MSEAAGSEEPDAVAGSTFCGQCGEDIAAPVHERCDRRAELEPPRFCSRCRRRMVVQVTPRGWTARCSRHGTLTS